MKEQPNSPLLLTSVPGRASRFLTRLQQNGTLGRLERSFELTQRGSSSNSPFLSIVECMMDDYWFTVWLKEHRVKDEASLRNALSYAQTINSLLKAMPPSTIPVRDTPPTLTELTAGKGIDLTGGLGCHHIDCLAKEVGGLFRHAWHYFDRIVLPDQALFHVKQFDDHCDLNRLVRDLTPFVLVLRLLEKSGGARFVRFETRAPACRQHFERHARDAGIDQSFSNIEALTTEVLSSASIAFDAVTQDNHAHIDFELRHLLFEHTEWGTLCSVSAPLPEDEPAIRHAIAVSVVQKYLSELSADALAARRRRTTLGTTIPFYKRLLATHPSPQVEDVAFELALPISPDIPVSSLMKIRKSEGECFERFQTALRTAIAERIKTASSPSAAAYAQEIKRDVIDPELRRVRDVLNASRTLAIRNAATGLGLGISAATVGLLTPLHTNPIGIGLTVGGAISLGASSVKKAVDDHLTVRKDVSLSDMYFLWRAHGH